MGASVIAADCGPKVRSFGQGAATTCAAPPSVIACQRATSAVGSVYKCRDH